jgi:nitrogen fixation NifU-like protein
MLEDQLYRETLLEIFRNPPNKGEIRDPDLEARLANPLCGDEIRIQLKLANRRVEKAVFSGSGCAISQASASLLVEYIEGKDLTKVKKLGPKDMLKIVGIKPTPARMGCVLLGLEVLQKALKKA